MEDGCRFKAVGTESFLTSKGSTDGVFIWPVGKQSLEDRKRLHTAVYPSIHSSNILFVAHLSCAFGQNELLPSGTPRHVGVSPTGRELRWQETWEPAGEFLAAMCVHCRQQQSRWGALASPKTGLGAHSFRVQWVTETSLPCLDALTLRLFPFQTLPSRHCSSWYRGSNPNSICLLHQSQSPTRSPLNASPHPSPFGWWYITCSPCCVVAAWMCRPVNGPLFLYKWTPCSRDTPLFLPRPTLSTLDICFELIPRLSPGPTFPLLTPKNLFPRNLSPEIKCSFPAGSLATVCTLLLHQ